MREFEDRLRNLKMSVCGSCFKEMIEKAKQERDLEKLSGSLGIVP